MATAFLPVAVSKCCSFWFYNLWMKLAKTNAIGQMMSSSFCATTCYNCLLYFYISEFMFATLYALRDGAHELFSRLHEEILETINVSSLAPKCYILSLKSYMTLACKCLIMQLYLLTIISSAVILVYLFIYCIWF